RHAGGAVLELHRRRLDVAPRRSIGQDEAERDRAVKSRRRVAVLLQRLDGYVEALVLGNAGAGCRRVDGEAAGGVRILIYAQTAGAVRAHGTDPVRRAAIGAALRIGRITTYEKDQPAHQNTPL